MSETLQLLGDLREALHEAGGPELLDRQWRLVLLIESSLDRDPSRTDVDRNNMARLRSGVTHCITAHREGLNASYSLATMPLTALEDAIKRRTTGVDGWPLR